MCYIKLFVCSLLLVTISAAPIEQNNLAFQRYAQTLNNPKLIPFLSECLPKATSKKDAIFCNTYFDMLLHLNEDPSAQNILEIQSSSGREDIVKNFCTHFIENIPKTSNVTMYTEDVEQFYKIIVTDENCKTFCLDLDSDLKKTVKHKCVLLSWGYDSIARTRLIDATKVKTVSSNVEETAAHQPDPNAVVAPVIPPNQIKFVDQTKENVGSQIKQTEQSKTIVPVNEITLKENSQLPSKIVTPEPQTLLSAEDRKPIDTIPSSSEKNKNTEKSEDLDSSKNPINDPKLSEQSVIEPSESDLIEEKEVKEVDIPDVTESSDLNSALNLDENGNDNNAFDRQQNNDEDPDADADTDDDESAGHPPDMQEDKIKEPDTILPNSANIQNKDNYVFAENPKEEISDPFFAEGDSNFFTYFMLLMLLCIIMYVGYHNKSKVLALVLEGRRGSNSRGGGRRKHTAAYRKLDSNLEEAITSGASSRASQIIY